MYLEKIDFPKGIPIAYEGWQAGRYHLHAHKDVIEILMVIKGKTKVVVSCETFEMDEGDYVVIRESDSHTFSAADSGCEVVSLYLRMGDYLEKIPYLYYVIFGCESFDLAKYRNETAKIRGMIAAIITNLIRSDEASTQEAIKAAENLLWLLVNDYDMAKYYNRNWDAPFRKVEKYYKIMGYIFDCYFMKNIQEHISQNEFYSKSYITHLFKEVGASSFKDMLDYVRIFKSEEMLLNSDLSINEISDRCGFSDIKYYTANFKKWFLCTPSEYKKNALQEINKKSIFNDLSSMLIADRLSSLTKVERGETLYKAAVNPLSVKAFGMLAHEMRAGGKAAPSGNDMPEGSNPKASLSKHLMLLKLDAELLKKSNSELAAYLESYDNSGFMPMLAVDLREISDSKCRETIVKCIETFETEKIRNREIYVLYNDLGEYSYINKLILEINSHYSFNYIRPLFMG